MVMPSNNTYWLVHYWAGRYGNLGHLYSPQRQERPMPHLPYALDNGAYSAFKNKTVWDVKAWHEHIERYAWLGLRPEWLIVPDVVANAEMTLSNWEFYSSTLEHYRIPLALAVQDGMTPADVATLRTRPDLIFVGGSTEWKWQTVGMWCRNFPRVHVGRVNTARQLDICKLAGAESVDGTGWFRGRPQQILELGLFLMREAGLDETAHVAHIVHHSRFKGADQLCLPMERCKIA